MNKLLFPNGGLPLYGNDFDFMQSSLREGIHTTLRPICEQTGGKMVVSGCALSFNSGTGSYFIAAGWVMIDYELLWFVGGDTGVTDPNGIIDIELEAYTYADTHANATRTMVDSSSQNIWQRREARFAVTPVVTKLQVALNEFRLPYLIAKMIEGAADTTVTLTDFDNGWSGGGLFTPKGIRRGNTVILRGSLEVGTIDIITYTLAFTLQSGYRPKVRQYFVCAMPNTSIGLVDILTTGEVFVKYLLNDTVSPASLLDISNIRFEAA